MLVGTVYRDCNRKKKKVYMPFTSKGLLNNIYNINVEEDTVALNKQK